MGKSVISFQSILTHFLVRSCVDRLAGDGTHTITDEMNDVEVAGLHHVEVSDSKGRVGTRQPLRLNTAASASYHRSENRSVILPLTLMVLHAQERDEPTVPSSCAVQKSS